MIAVFASGAGSNFAMLAEAFPGHVRALVCNVEGAGVVTLAKERGVPTRVLPHVDFADRGAHERAMLEALAALVADDAGGAGTVANLSLLVLAGYMRILGHGFLEAFSARWHGASIVNLHPAHLDEYRGARAYEHAVASLAPRWGLSVHRVTEVLDGGELVASVELPVYPWETAEALRARARPLEHALLERAVAALLERDYKAK